MIDNMLIRKSYYVAISCIVSVLAAQDLAAQAPPSNKPDAATQVAAPTSGINQVPAAYPAAAKINYVRTRSALAPITTEVAFGSAGYTDVSQATQYVDGLGRPVQTVSRQASPGAKDLVAPVTYDAFGRETFKYLPYAQSTGVQTADGLFKTDAFADQATFYQNTTLNPGLAGEQVYYSQTIFEASPLNRIERTMAPGNSWAGSGVGIQQKYLINTEPDVVRIWSIGSGLPTTSQTYGAGQLYKMVAIDEHGNAVVEYKDKEGQVILKKVQSGAIAADYSGYEGFLCTYYVYDDFNLLRCVIQPEGVKELYGNGWQSVAQGLCFYYNYDERNRMISKQVPGAGVVYMVYDQRDRLVFSQDANMRSANNWLATLYDALNRPVMTGMITYTGDRDALQAYVNSTLPGESEIVTAHTPGNSNVFVDERITTESAYQASNSITFNAAFQSETNAEFIAEIIPLQGTNEPVSIAGNPLPPGHNFVALTITYYDDYEWNAGANTYSTAYNNQLDAGNNPHAEALPAQHSGATQGMVTGTRVRVIENPANLAAGAWLTSISYYDEKGRLVQSQSENYKGGLDIVTNRYDFSGKILTNYLQHSNPAAGVASHLRIKTNMEYDHAGRLLEVFKTINDDAGTRVRIAANEYDELGQLKKKAIGQKKDENGDYTSDPLEWQEYTYNIRGWLQGINKGYARGASQGIAPWFGMELNYDWGFDIKNYNGNIAGTRWRSRGDGEQRAYGYTYDKANRIMSADFGQHNGTAYADNVNGMNFDMMMGDGVSPTLAYDANGNIKAMKQWGWKPGGSTLIDDLQYQYFTHLGNPNALMSVSDAANDANSKLGDFKEPAIGGQSYDYLYDGNGNMVMDFNKRILNPFYVGMSLIPMPGITYNHINLPYEIRFHTGMTTATNSITYIYDAAGNKLEKRVKEDKGINAQPRYKEDNTTYIGSLVYQNDKLQLIGHEEGRIRPVEKVENGQTVQELVFDYFLKDHLGNVRMVLTEQRETNHYIATMEQPYRQTEEKLFYNINEAAFAKSSVPGEYPADPNETNPNDFVARLNGSDTKLGPSLILKVMSGDKVDIGVKSLYRQQGSAGPESDPVENLLYSLASGIVGSTGGSKGSLAELSNPLTSPLLGAVTTFRETHNTGQVNRPKAYLNWILLDEQFRYVGTGSQSGAMPVTTPDILETLGLNDIEITKNGFLYIYVSNETENWNVYFDNLSVRHYTGPLVEETHYYPFGLAMAGISGKALKPNYSENKFKFGGKEFQSAEFSDKSGLELYDFGARNYNPQIGRWHNCDPHADKYLALSPYAYVANNPLIFVDPDGKDIKPTAAFLASKYGAIYSNLSKNNSVYAGLVSKYSNSKTFNLTLNYGDKNVPKGFSGWTETQFRANASKPSTPLSAQSDQYFSHSALTTTLETATKIHSYEKTEIGMVQTMLHESVHSMLGGKGIKEMNGHNTFNKYHDMLVEGLKEYNSENNLGLTDTQLNELAYGGTQESKQFKEYIQSLATQSGTTYDDELKSYKERLGALLYKHVKTEQKVTSADSTNNN